MQKFVLRLKMRFVSGQKLKSFEKNEPYNKSDIFHFVWKSMFHPKYIRVYFEKQTKNTCSKSISPIGLVKTVLWGRNMGLLIYALLML